jgi:hypothetical protein
MQFFPDIRRVGAKSRLCVLQAEAERMMSLAAMKSASASGFQKTFGQLLSNVVRTSPALENVNLPLMRFCHKSTSFPMIVVGSFAPQTWRVLPVRSLHFRCA